MAGNVARPEQPGCAKLKSPASKPRTFSTCCTTGGRPYDAWNVITHITLQHGNGWITRNLIVLLSNRNAIRTNAIWETTVSLRINTASASTTKNENCFRHQRGADRTDPGNANLNKHQHNDNPFFSAAVAHHCRLVVVWTTVAFQDLPQLQTTSLAYAPGTARKNRPRDRPCTR
jgi:hypothetical protein